MRRNYNNISAKRLFWVGIVTLIISIIVTIILSFSDFSFFVFFGILWIALSIMFIFFGASNLPKTEKPRKPIKNSSQTSLIYKERVIKEHIELQNKVTLLYKYRDEPIMRSEIIKMCNNGIEFFENNKSLIGYTTPCYAYYRLVNLYTESKEIKEAIQICETAIKNKQYYPDKDYFYNKLETLKEIKK